MSSAPSFLPISFRGANFQTPAFWLTWLPFFLFVAVIALESTSAFGSNHTSAPLHRFFHFFLGAQLNSQIDAHWTHLHHLLRKAGHLTGFAILSLLCYRGFRATLGRSAHDYSAAINHALIAFDQSWPRHSHGITDRQRRRTSSKLPAQSHRLRRRRSARHHRSRSGAARALSHREHRRARLNRPAIESCAL